MFVEFQRCTGCTLLTDLCCSNCSQFLCANHSKRCCCCCQIVCLECGREDECCEQPRNKTEKHLSDFYDGKIVNTHGFYVLYTLNMTNDGYATRLRQQVAARSVAYLISRDTNFSEEEVLEMESGRFEIASNIPGECSVDQIYQFLLSIASTKLFSLILLFCEKREKLLLMLERFLREDDDVLISVINCSVSYPMGKELFRLLKKHGFLEFRKLGNCAASHTEALKWIEENKRDVFKNTTVYRQYVNTSSAEILEYLLVEKSIDFDFIIKHTHLAMGCEILKMIVRVKGLHYVQKLSYEDMVLDFDTVKFLREEGFHFDVEEIERYCTGSSLYPLVCFGILHVCDMGEYRKNQFLKYISSIDIKACPNMMKFMKAIRKKKIETVLWCLKNIPKDVVWKIIDFAYSPPNEIQ